MPGFKYGSGNTNTGLCSRLGCYADATTTTNVGGTTYSVCKRHR